MALNKILYFSHGWHLATTGEPLVAHAFEAWEHGPVLPTIYHQFKRFRDAPIQARATLIDIKTGRDLVARCEISPRDNRFLDRMVLFYGPKSGLMLSTMSHEADAPWALIRANSKPGMIISDELIRGYFSAKLKTKGRRSDAH